MLSAEKINDNLYSIKFDGKEITQLHFNSFEIANRPYFFPVLCPNGKCVVRHFPMEKIEGETHDHPHHTGVWTAWGAVNGTDNWAFGEKMGRQYVRKIDIKNVADGLEIVLDIDWTTPDGKTNQLAETRTIHIYDPAKLKKVEGASPAYVYDFKVHFKAKYGAVKFGDTKEGGLLSVRVATPLDVPKGGRIENGCGKVSADKNGEKDVWGKRAPWCGYSGKLDGESVGIAILDHPKNPVAPTYWHVRNYGLMTANPFGKSHFVFPLLKGTYRLAANKESIWQYRLVVHDGTTSDAKLPQHYAMYLQ